MRVPLALLLLASYGCDDECESLPPQFELDIKSGTSMGSLTVIVGLDGVRRSETFEIGNKLDDGETSVVIELDPEIDTEFQVDVTLYGYSGPNGNGQAVAMAYDLFEGTPDGCNRFELELGAPDPQFDAGFPDGGQPICAPICLDANCNLDCSGICDPCQMSCSGATDACNTACDEGTCNVFCVDVDNCDSDCGPGTTCEISCDRATICTAKCTGGASCLLKCESAGTCDFTACSGTETPCPDGSLACNHACP